MTDANLPSLTRLILSTNQLTNLSGLANANLSNLTILDLNNNEIRDINPIVNLTSLTGIYLSTNRLTNLNGLANANLPNLTILDLNNNEIRDISPIVNLTSLTGLDLSYNQLIDLKGLTNANFPNLTALYLSYNQLTDLNGLTDANFPKLTILDLNNNGVQNILPLVESTGFKSVSQIHLHKNPLDRIDILIHVPALKARGVTVQFDYPVDWNMVSTLVGDIDGNNSVNILDLVIVAMQFGKTGSDLLGDVNGDSLVNVFDLVVVAGNFDERAVMVAPAVLANKLIFTTQQKRSIQSAVVKLEEMLVWSEAEGLAFNLLKAILAERLPIETKLLPNYPNPFNPETWIPFELNQDSKVSVAIYNVAGTLVRNINVGYLQAGIYVSQSRAIYWDGRTDNGERVANGTHFCTLRTDASTLTRKMIILK